MKKVLLAGTALMGLAVLSAPAHAEVDLDLGGFFSGYGVFSDNNEPAAASLREFDLRRDTEVYVSGEATLDNGLTVGFHTEQDLGGATMTDEAYVYFSGTWGRVNLGSEDGAAYLLQVAAPGADSNTDGLRTYIQALAAITPQTQFRSITNTVAPVTTNYNFTTVGGATFGGGTTLDYDNADFTNTDKLSYLTPKFEGFQAGLSYAPEQGQNAVGNNVAAPTSDIDGVGFIDAGTPANNTTAQYEDIWEAAARWDGEFSGFGISLGGGYVHASPEGNAVIAAANTGDIGVTGDLESWNAGLAVSFSGFSVGGTYLESEVAVTGAVNDDGNATATRSGDVNRSTWVVGAAWDNGPYHLGGSWLHQETEFPLLSNLDAAANAVDVYFPGDTHEVEKYTLGGGYTFGPGMTFRGSVAWGEFQSQLGGAANNDFTQVAVGTEINF